MAKKAVYQDIPFEKLSFLQKSFLLRAVFLVEEEETMRDNLCMQRLEWS